jgi:hypothetical protein
MAKAIRTKKAPQGEHEHGKTITKGIFRGEADIHIAPRRTVKPAGKAAKPAAKAATVGKAAKPAAKSAKPGKGAKPASKAKAKKKGAPVEYFHHDKRDSLD